VRLAEQEFWHCNGCDTDKPRNEWPVWSRPIGRPAYCIACSREIQAQYRKDNREKIRARNKNSKQKRKELDPEGEARKNFHYYYREYYNISLEQYEILFEEQEKVCGICRKTDSRNIRLAVDHDKRCCPGRKSCGKCVRGLLCGNCNRKLGFYEIYKEKCYIWINREPKFPDINILLSNDLYSHLKADRNIETYKERKYRNHLKSKYSIPIEFYNFLVEIQTNLCGICGQEERSTGRRLAVDHDRKCCPAEKSCGQCIRGLLCSSCNPKLGFYEIYMQQFHAWIDRRAQFNVELY
jgi:hypothetical protein